MTTAANVQATTVNLDLYVATGVGSDLNPGTSVALPVATYAAALRLIPFEIKHRVIIHMAAGTYLVTSSIGPKVMDAPIFVYGDGAGQAGQDGFTQLVAPAAAAAGSSANVLVSGGGFTVNQYRGKTIQITSGPAVGDLRTIRSNTATDFIPAASFSAAVAAGNTYRIVEPSVVLEFELTSSSVPSTADTTPLVRNCGGGSPYPLDTSTFSFQPPVGVYLCNLRFKTKTGDADVVGAAAIVNSTACFFGVEFVADTSKTLRALADQTSVLLSGFDYFPSATAPLALRPFDNGFATGRRSWSGWGLGDVSGGGTVSYSDVVNFIGYLAVSRFVSLLGATWRVMGGSIISTAISALRVGSYSRVFFTGNSSVPSLIRLELNTADSSAIEVFSGAQIELGQVTIEKQDQGYCIWAAASGSGLGAIEGRVGVNSNVVLTGNTVTTAPTNAIRCMGGRVDLRTTTLTISGFATGTQLAIGSGSGTVVVQQCDLADLAVAGNQLPCLPHDIFFLANGLLIGFANAAAPGTFDPSAMIDGLREISRFSLIDTIRMTQVVDGGAGTTTMEIFRRRAGANTSLGTVSIAAGAAFGTATLTPASVALRTLNVGDLLFAQFNARQTTTAAFVTLEILGAGIDGRYGWIRRL